MPPNAQVQNTEPLELSQPEEKKPNPANNPTNPTPVDIILADPNKTDLQKKQEIIDRIPAEDKKGADGFERTFNPDGSERFNPPNTRFFGFSNINQGKGLASDSSQAKELEDFLSKGGNISDITVIDGIINSRNKNNSFGFDILPGAFADEPAKVNSQPQNKIEKTNVDQQSINVKGESKGVKITGAFSADDTITGAIIRPTPVDRSKLLADEDKNLTETASQRANRVFQEIGNFVDVKKGATSIDKTKNSNFDFGTNTGSGQKGGTVEDTKINRAERLAREAERARAVFDAGRISNF